MLNFIKCFHGAPSATDTADEDEERSPAIVIWDIENVRLPLPPLSTTSTIQAVKRTFIADKGHDLSDAMMVCALTETSLRAMERTWPSFLREMVPLMDVRLGCASRPKLGADFVLRRELSAFMDRYTRVASRSRIVLLTGDVDYLEPVQQALRLGFDVQLVHYGPNTSAALLAQPYVSPPVEWVGFLADALNDGISPAMPYETKEQRDAKTKAMEEAKRKAQEAKRKAIDDARRKAQEAKGMEKAEAKARAQEQARAKADEARARAMEKAKAKAKSKAEEEEAKAKATEKATEKARAEAKAEEEDALVALVQERRLRRHRRIRTYCACLLILAGICVCTFAWNERTFAGNLLV